MHVSKKEGNTLNKIITHWQETDVISEEEAHKLKSSYQVTPFDWKRVAKYSFWVSIICLFSAISAALSDRWLMNLLERLFSAPDSVKCMACVLIAACAYYLGIRRKQRYPKQIYSNEAIFFIGIASTALAIFFLGVIFKTDDPRVSILLLLATVIYGLLGLWFPSKTVWLFALISLGSWFGAETGYVSGWGAYYFGMNYPLRFVLFGTALIFGGSYLFTVWQQKRLFLRMTRSVGLLYLFNALWLMSIFGNYGDPDKWAAVSQIELFHWSILFALAAIAAIYHGVKYDDTMTRGYGLTFLFINLYTRYFEFFWDGTHKAIFFFILGLSFWYLGARAEKIWQFNLTKTQSNE